LQQRSIDEPPPSPLSLLHDQAANAARRSLIVQLIVIIAFASVLGLPEGGWPYPLLAGGRAPLAVIVAATSLLLVLTRKVNRAVLASLERPQLPPSHAQNLFVKGQLTLRAAALLAHLGLIGGTEFTGIVSNSPLHRLPGLAEGIILIPFVAWMILSYACIYPADRAIRTTSVTDMLRLDYPVRPIWSRRQFLEFHLRYHFLIVAVPLTVIIIARDVLDLYRRQLVALTGFTPMPEALLGLTAMIIFTFSPQLIRYLWKSRPLPADQLRSRLEDLAHRVGLKYRDILVWPSNSMVINAAVMGVLPQVRYIMLSDGLIETMTDGQIEAVFAHELAHIKKHHIPYYLMFAFCSMGLVGSAVVLADAHLPAPVWLTEGMGIMAILVLWLFLFGMLSRRFEWEADLYAASSLSASIGDCIYENCHRHGRNRSQNPDAPCMVAAEIFATALDRIAVLNGVPRTAKSWRHGSIWNRCKLIRLLAAQPAQLARFQQQLWTIRLALICSSLVTAAVGLHILRNYSF